MIVVADTTPLNYLILMGAEGVLAKLYGRVVVPQAVITEMCATGAPPTVAAWASTLPDWVDVAEASEAEDTSLPSRLGVGEREAIALALSLHADVLLMDDHPGRLAAEARGLFVTGTLSVLLQGSRLHFLDFEEAIAGIKRLGFRMSADVEEKMRSLAARP